MYKHENAIFLFNEWVGRLEESTLGKRMDNPNYTLDYDRMMKYEWISVDGVTQESVYAFVLNLRLLVQNGDGFSIRELANNVYAQTSVPLVLREGFFRERDRLCEHMDRITIFPNPGTHGNFTNKELFDVIMYGGIAHAKAGKVHLFYLLTKHGMFSSVLCVSFLNSLGVLLRTVRAIRQINEELLNHWRMQPQDGRVPNPRPSGDDG